MVLPLIRLTLKGKPMKLRSIEPPSIPSAKLGYHPQGKYQILVAYASQFGTTKEVAQSIGKTLDQEGYTVEVQWVKQVKSIDHYDAIIIGSAIQYDKWMPEAVEFVKTNQALLKQRTVAYFFTCMTLARRNEKTERKAVAYSDKLYALMPHINPISVGRFAGAIDYRKLSFFLRFMLKGFLSIVGIREGDYRDWGAIQTWAKQLPLVAN